MADTQKQQNVSGFGGFGEWREYSAWGFAVDNSKSR